MYDKLVILKNSILAGANKEHLAMMVDECMYKTGQYRNGTTKNHHVYTKEELTVMRAKKREAMKMQGRNHRWNADDVKTEARKRYEEAMML